jgi:hypothetical protein
MDYQTRGFANPLNRTGHNLQSGANFRRCGPNTPVPNAGCFSDYGFADSL